MGCKQMDNNFSFMDLSLADSMNRNRSVARMEKINAIIDWSKIESLLLKNYAIGKSVEGADAYPLRLLLKYFLIQQWFHIEYDPELETKINDRISFKPSRSSWDFSLINRRLIIPPSVGFVVGCMRDLLRLNYLRAAT